MAMGIANLKPRQEKKDRSPESRWTCRNCGAANEIGATVCAHCGAAIIVMK